MFDQIATPAALGKVPVEGTPGRLRLGDVATSVEDHQPLIGDAVVATATACMLVVEKFPGANTLEVTKGVEAALDELKPGLAGMQIDTSVFRPATFIEDAIDNLTLAIMIGGGLLLALVLAALLFHWRTVADHASSTIPRLAGGGGARARPPRRDVQRDLVRRARGGARDRDRRRRRRRRERRARRLRADARRAQRRVEPLVAFARGVARDRAARWCTRR